VSRADRSGWPRLLALTSATGGVAQLVERLTGSQEVRGFKSHRLHQKFSGEPLAAYPDSPSGFENLGDTLIGEKRRRMLR
jgi:hypothetical protein